MINKPSLLDTPNLINAKEYTPGLDPVDDCYANDSAIRQNYDGTDTSEWNTGKQVQETLPAAEWDAWMHDLSAFGWQITEILNSIYGELYSAIHGQQTGMPHELLDKFTALPSNTETLTNKTIAITSNDITGTASKMLQTDATGKVITTSEDAANYVTAANTKTLTNKTISFDDNTLQNVASLNTAQTLTNKTIDGYDNILKVSPTYARDTALLSFANGKIAHIYFDAESTGGPYTLDSAPYSGYEVRLTVSAAAPTVSLTFLSAVDSGSSVTKTLSPGVHHLTWQGTWGWTFYELSGTYIDNTTFTYLL
jgi:hypothetical protein